MKKLSVLVLLLMLSGCVSSCTPKIIYVSVYTPPKVTLPERPVLVSNGVGDVNTITKNAEKDLIDLKSYATQLENIISKIFKIEN